MDIRVQHNVGDTVWCVLQTFDRIRKTCPFCAGASYVVGANDKTRVCPQCYGRGYITIENHIIHEVKQCKVNEIEIWIKENITIMYYVTSDNTERECLQSNVFHTRGKAEKRQACLASM